MLSNQILTPLNATAIPNISIQSCGFPQLSSVKNTSNVTDDGIPNSVQIAAMVLTWIVIVIDIIGLLGSLLIIAVRLSPSLKSPVNLLLIGLGVADAGVLFFGPIAFAPQSLYQYYSMVSPYWKDALKPVVLHCLRWMYPFALMSQTASIYILVLVTVERYLAICRPLLARRLCTIKRTSTGLISVFGFALLYNSPTVFENEIAYANGSVYLDYNYDYWYRVVYDIWMYLIVMFVVPFVILAVLNFRIIVSLRQSIEFRNGAARNERSTTMMLLIVTLIFLITNSFIFGVRIYVTVPHLRFQRLQQLLNSGLNCSKKLAVLKELAARRRAYRRDIVSLLVSSVNFMVTLNSAVNFPIYYRFSVVFRNGFRDFCFGGKDAFHLSPDPRSSARASSLLIEKNNISPHDDL